MPSGGMPIRHCICHGGGCVLVFKVFSSGILFDRLGLVLLSTVNSYFIKFPIHKSLETKQANAKTLKTPRTEAPPPPNPPVPLSNSSPLVPTMAYPFLTSTSAGVILAPGSYLLSHTYSVVAVKGSASALFHPSGLLFSEWTLLFVLLICWLVDILYKVVHEDCG